MDKVKPVYPPFNFVEAEVYKYSKSVIHNNDSQGIQLICFYPSNTYLFHSPAILTQEPEE